MKQKKPRHFITWSLTMLTAFALVISSWASFAFATEDASAEPSKSATAVEEPENPVGGWSPVELIPVPPSDEIQDEPAEIPSEERKLLRSTEPTADPVFTESTSTMGYDALETDAQRKFYDMIDQAESSLLNSKIDVSPVQYSSTIRYTIAAVSYKDAGIEDYYEAAKVYNAYDYDHPAYYWISNLLGFNKEEGVLRLFTKEEYAPYSARARINNLIVSGVNSYVDLAERGTDTLDKIAIIHDKIVNDIAYAYDDYGSPETEKWAHSVHGVFDPEYKQVVCEGYADAFSMIMNYMDIPNYYIVGTAGSGGPGGNGGHAWNAVSADGGKTYLYMDLTWDDRGGDGYSYKYFGMPQANFEELHFKDTPDSSGRDWLYATPGPYNNSFEGTYYNQGGFYYDGNADADSFASIVKAKAARSGDFVSIMSPNTDSLSAAAIAIGSPDYKSRTVTYNGTEYYYTTIVLQGHEHVHDWTETTYTWSIGKYIRSVTAKRVCKSPHCDEQKQVETAYPDEEVLVHETCTEDGREKLTATFKNPAFETQVKIIVREAYGHNWGDWVVIKEPTDYEPGLKRRTCQWYESHTEEALIHPLKAHITTAHPATEATCTEDGNIAYWKCDLCNKCFSDEACAQEITEEDAIVKVLGHKWDSGKVTKEATATAEGVKTFTCTACGITKTEVIPAKGYAPGEDPDQMGEDGTPAGKGASAVAAEKAIMNAATDEGPAGTKYAPLMLKSTKQAKKSVTIKWTKITGANKYVIYGTLCGKTNKMKKIGTSTGKTKTVKKIAGKALKKGKYYKFIVVALDKNNKVVSTSKVCHAATKGGKVGNHKSVTVKKAVVNKAKKLKKGRTLKLRAKAVAKSTKLKVKNHRKVSYESTTPAIATVSKAGVVKGKKKGTCYVYAYAQNGVSKKIKVVVK